MKYFLNEKYEYDFSLIGISCHEKDYRLCWALNQTLFISLKKKEETLEVLLKKTNEISRHSIYFFLNEDTKNEFYLICNRSSSGLLIPEQAHADYLMMIKENYSFSVEKLLSKIKEIPFILTAFTVSVDTLKSKENLIF